MTKAHDEAAEAKQTLESIHGRMTLDWFAVPQSPCANARRRYSRVINAIEEALSAWDEAEAEMKQEQRGDD